MPVPVGRGCWSDRTKAEKNDQGKDALGTVIRLDHGHEMMLWMEDLAMRLLHFLRTIWKYGQEISCLVSMVVEVGDFWLG